MRGLFKQKTPRWKYSRQPFFIIKASFKCRVCSEKLPGNEFGTYGGLHTHSIYSQSHVEFGPPIKVYDRMASASGLDFLGITITPTILPVRGIII
jgi:hypothetical protein